MCAALSAGCAPKGPPPAVPSPPAIASPPSTSLDGRIYEVSARRFVTRAELEAKLAAADFVLLGEKHDDPLHHRLQAEAVLALLAKGRKPAVAFEMLDVGKQATVDTSRAAGADATALAHAVDWEHSGWPPFDLYKPVFDAALAGALPIVAANLPRADVRKLAHGGADAAELARLGVDQPLREPLAGSLRRELRDSHCGQLPEEMIEPMVLAQRARDVEMATMMVAAGQGRGAVLVAGAGHVRTDRGVPMELARRAPGAKIVSVAFEEVAASASEVSAYRDEPYDFLWFTPTFDRGDPCAQFGAAKRGPASK